jgi:hypothetical protein
MRRSIAGATARQHADATAEVLPIDQPQSREAETMREYQVATREEWLTAGDEHERARA